MKRLLTFLLVVVLGASHSEGATAAKCIRIYYDAPPHSNHTFGKTIAVMLRNLVGHFQNYSVHFSPVESYRKGDVDSCNAVIYIGTYYDNVIPSSFLTDFEKTKKNAAWLGANIWQLDEALGRLWGVKYRGVAGVDPKVDAGTPRFFKFFEYKGETFTKYGQFSPTQPETFDGAPELTLYDRLEAFSQTEVVAMATHSWTQEKAPYILRKGNHWVVGDTPFTYITEEDRYLIFADVLFDILGEPARWNGKRPALVRLEDVHMKVPDWQLEGMVGLFSKVGIPFSISLIPIFADPLMVLASDPSEKLVPMTKSPQFVSFLKNAKTKGASYLYHGVTHQYGEKANSQNGLSGVDYEFWDDVKQKPIAEDSPSFVVKRLEKGLTYLDSAGTRPSAWVTPHYASSVLDHVIFGQLFSWKIGRGRYVPARWNQSSPMPSRFRMENTGSSDNGRRLRFFNDLKVTITANEPLNGQFFPYEIYTDYYGASYIPENVGYVQLLSDRPVSDTVDTMVARLKRNRVLRDAWASFYIHPYLFARVADEHQTQFEENSKELERLLREAVAQGYEFIDVKTWVKNH